MPSFSHNKIPNLVENSTSVSPYWLAHHESSEKQFSMCLLEDVLKRVPLSITEFTKNYCPCKRGNNFFLSILSNLIFNKNFAFYRIFSFLLNTS